MTAANTYRRRGKNECRACNNEARERRRDEAKRVAGTKPCECGCGTVIAAIDSNGRPARYVRGHQRRGGSNTWLIKNEVNRRTMHSRAIKLKQAVGACEWAHLGHCLGHLQVAHVDGDEWNNDPGNLLKLCQSHHRLLDNGRIDPACPVMPAYVVRGGKRRYVR